MQKYTGNKLALVMKLRNLSGIYPNEFSGGTQKMQFSTFREVINPATDEAIAHALHCIEIDEWDQSEILMNPLVWK